MAGRGSENLSFGQTTGIEIVMELFVDDGLSNRMHRSNLVDKNFSFTGNFSGPHKDRGTMTTQDFFDDFWPKKTKVEEPKNEAPVSAPKET